MVVDYSVDYIKFPKNKISLSPHILKQSMHMCYNNFIFSTHNYNNNGTSINSLKYHKSGNCVAFSMINKIYLKNNYNINSYIILASVPKKLKKLGLNDVCHCALCIPIDSTKYYIIDCVLYMNDPILIDTESSAVHNGVLTDIYKNKPLYYTYTSQKVNTSENILPYTLSCKCTFDHSGDTWYYYLNEIFNPDESLSIPYYISIHPNHLYIKTIIHKDNILLSNTV
tara:strand:- start:476 stop:1153 length:678 start_codon:yes stop_codon:yes gene_type:complete